MLKIKDNVDLRRLEEFGFEYRQALHNQYEHYVYLIKDREGYRPRLICCVWCNDRKISIFSNFDGLDKMYDLIQAGLVEKVKH